MSIVTLKGTRCEIILGVSLLKNGTMQCPNLAIGFWSPSKGIWHPVCQGHLDSIQAANLTRDVQVVSISQPPPGESDPSVSGVALGDGDEPAVAAGVLKTPPA